tara:strand:+ start:2990 stop:3622 length:633 start_codon:yes stop_codon:yes gene_type:complete
MAREVLMNGETVVIDDEAGTVTMSDGNLMSAAGSKAIIGANPPPPPPPAPEPTVASGLSQRALPSPRVTSSATPSTPRASIPRGSYGYYAEVLYRYRQLKGQQDALIAAQEEERRSMSEKTGYEISVKDSVFLNQPGNLAKQKEIWRAADPVNKFIAKNPGIWDLVDPSEVPSIGRRAELEGPPLSSVNLGRLSEAEKKVWAAGPDKISL